MSPCGSFTGYPRIEWLYLLVGLLLKIMDFHAFEFTDYFGEVEAVPVPVVDVIKLFLEEI